MLQYVLKLLKISHWSVLFDVLFSKWHSFINRLSKKNINVMNKVAREGHSIFRAMVDLFCHNMYNYLHPLIKTKGYLQITSVNTFFKGISKAENFCWFIWSQNPKPCLQKFIILCKGSGHVCKLTKQINHWYSNLFKFSFHFISRMDSSVIQCLSHINVSFCC